MKGQRTVVLVSLECMVHGSLCQAMWKGMPMPRLLKSTHVHTCEGKIYLGLALTKSTAIAGKKLNKIKASICLIVGI